MLLSFRDWTRHPNCPATLNRIKHRTVLSQMPRITAEVKDMYFFSIRVSYFSVFFVVKSKMNSFYICLLIYHSGFLHSFVVYHQIFTWHHFYYFWRTSFKNSHSAGLRTISSLNFCLFEKVFISCSFLKVGSLGAES